MVVGSQILGGEGHCKASLIVSITIHEKDICKLVRCKHECSYYELELEKKIIFVCMHCCLHPANQCCK